MRVSQKISCTWNRRPFYAMYVGAMYSIVLASVHAAWLYWLGQISLYIRERVLNREKMPALSFIWSAWELDAKVRVWYITTRSYQRVVFGFFLLFLHKFWSTSSFCLHVDDYTLYPSICGHYFLFQFSCTFNIMCYEPARRSCNFSTKSLTTAVIRHD
jgi:hypothetical protein